VIHYGEKGRRKRGEGKGVFRDGGVTASPLQAKSSLRGEKKETRIRPRTNNQLGDSETDSSCDLRRRNKTWV